MKRAKEDEDKIIKIQAGIRGAKVRKAQKTNKGLSDGGVENPRISGRNGKKQPPFGEGMTGAGNAVFVENQNDQTLKTEAKLGSFNYDQ